MSKQGTSQREIRGTHLDSVANMRDHLNCSTEILPSALALDYFAVDLSSSDVVVLAKLNIQEALVVTEVKVRLLVINIQILRRNAIRRRTSPDRKSTRLNSSHPSISRMPSSA